MRSDLSKPEAQADITNRGLNNLSYSVKTEFNNCFIIYGKYFGLISDA